MITKLVMAGLLAATVMTTTAQAETLRLLTWGSYAPDELIKKFEEKYPDITVEVTFSNNEEMIAKLRATGGAGFDRVLESGDFNFTVSDTGLVGRGVDSFSDVERVEVTGGGSANILYGGTVTNLELELNGAGGIDTIEGGALDDEIIGGVGNDVLTGNGGSDRFVYLATNNGLDIITDFTIDSDEIVIDALLPFRVTAGIHHCGRRGPVRVYRVLPGVDGALWA